jgi:hypothetical protein
MSSAKSTHAIVSSLFQANVRDRLLKDAEAQAEGFLRFHPENYGMEHAVEYDVNETVRAQDERRVSPR